MIRLSIAKQAAIIRALTQGSSIRSAGASVGVSKDTSTKLLLEFGEFASVYQDHRLRNLGAERIETLEAWSFAGTKPRNNTAAGNSDVWTFVAVGLESKLVVSWLIGTRQEHTAELFMLDVQSRFSKRDHPQAIIANGRGVVDLDPKVVDGPDSDPTHVSSSAGARVSPRLADVGSKRAQNHAYAVSAFYFIHNFERPHAALSKIANGVETTPAMAANLTNHVWTVEEMLGFMDPARRLASGLNTAAEGDGRIHAVGS